MPKSNTLKFVVLILAVFIVFNGKNLYALGVCAGETTYSGDPFCDSQCNPGPCSPGTLCCTEDDIEPGEYCCIDLAAVPELPSWFGPFFLATLVAGWEYWRNHRRKLLLTSVEKK